MTKKLRRVFGPKERSESAMPAPVRQLLLQLGRHGSAHSIGLRVVFSACGGDELVVDLSFAQHVAVPELVSQVDPLPPGSLQLVRESLPFEG
jgi:hypothetical protein